MAGTRTPLPIIIIIPALPPPPFLQGEDVVAGTRTPPAHHHHLRTSPPPFLQGEDVVAGTRTPLPISALSDVMPAVYAELLDITTRLEAHMKDMQVRIV